MRSTSATPLFLETLGRFLQSEEIPAVVGVGYSGGRDSGALLWGLVQVLGAQRLTALHVDHGWRSALERDQEAALVETWCRSLGVSLVHYPAPPTPGTTENEARQHRYRCFQSFLEEHPTAVVHLAHHADDQAETILMRLLKGRSWQGLSGMSARRGAYRRPVLSLRASILSRVAVEQNIPFHSDTTNQDVRPVRNFLRNDVMPLLQQRFPRVVESLNDFGELWSPVADPDLHSDWVLTTTGGQLPGARWDLWSSLERQAQLLSVATKQGAQGPLSRRFLETVCRPGRRGAAGAGGWTWSRVGNQVFWQRIAPQTQKEYFIVVSRNLVYDVGSYRFLWTEAGPGALAIPGVDPGAAWVWRSVVPGMRYRSQDSLDWGRDRRHKRFGSLESSKAALVVQGGLVRAVVDPVGKRVVWAESDVGKLHKPGIFVTLLSVTPKSTE